MPRLVPALAALLALAACQASSPPRGPEETCARACEAQARSCSPQQCARGCNLVLDRLAEREGGGVLACIASARECGDHAWSRCAARVGPHADGGPPPPSPAPEVEDLGGD